MAKKSLPKIRIYSDGSAKGNSDGPGGYGTIVKYMTDDDKTEKIIEYTEGFKVTTNNRMELMGVICGLESLTQPCEVMIYSDSKYVVDAFNHYWVNNWQSNGWLTATKMPVKNIDLWKRLLEAKKPHKCKFAWVKGHDGHPDNERCDHLAQSSSNGVKFERGEDGILYEVKETLKDDKGLTKEDIETPKLTLNKVVKDYVSQLTEDVKDYTITINGAKFIFDEEGNIAPHPDEDVDKCREVLQTLEKFKDHEHFADLIESMVVNRSLDSILCEFSNKIFSNFFTDSPTIPKISVSDK